MQRLILGLVEGEPGEITRQRGVSVDIEAEQITTFGDGTLVTGRAAGRVTRELTVPEVYPEAISSTVEERQEPVLTEFVADLDAQTPYVGVDSGDGVFLWDFLQLDWGVDIERAVIDIDALAAELRSLDHADVWQVAWNREDGDSVGVNYHRDAHLHGGDGLTQLGFAADWHGTLVEGTVARTGYLAEWSGLGVEQLATWVREAILPHARLPDDAEQATLDGGGD